MHLVFQNEIETFTNIVKKMKILSRKFQKIKNHVKTSTKSEERRSEYTTLQTQEKVTYV